MSNLGQLSLADEFMRSEFGDKDSSSEHSRCRIVAQSSTDNLKDVPPKRGFAGIARKLPPRSDQRSNAL